MQGSNVTGKPDVTGHLPIETSIADCSLFSIYKCRNYIITNVGIINFSRKFLLGSHLYNIGDCITVIIYRYIDNLVPSLV